MTRREILLAAAVAGVTGQQITAAGQQNLLYRLDSTDDSLTPAGHFFVRDHFPEPDLSLSSWRLKIEGRVGKPLELNLADILESRTRKQVAVLECAGNPALSSAVADGEWEGVPLADLLELAQISPDAVAVLLEGADAGRLRPDAREAPYCQMVPLSKCLRPESLVAFKLNGRFLPRRNGLPARALFPGWYGMNSVKWLQRILVLGPSDSTGNFQASGMNKLYNRIVETPSGELKVTRITEIQIRSSIVWPQDSARLPPGHYIVRGLAWTGEGLVRSVNLSFDGGHTWVLAGFENPPIPFTWVRWNCNWSPTIGDYLLISRAIDDAGREQPLKRDPSRKDSYELNVSEPVRCSVR